MKRVVTNSSCFDMPKGEKGTVIGVQEDRLLMIKFDKSILNGWNGDAYIGGSHSIIWASDVDEIS